MRLWMFCAGIPTTHQLVLLEAWVSDDLLNFLKENLIFNWWALDLRDPLKGFFHENPLEKIFNSFL